MTTRTTTATTATTVQVTISNVCHCWSCNDCGVLFPDRSAWPPTCPDPDCDTDDVDLGYCGGDCYTDAVAALNAAVAAWVEANPSVDREWVITGRGMGWRHRTGSAHIDLTRESLSEAVGVDSEWSQEWTIDAAPGGVLRGVQSHHDAMGETYDVEPLR